MSSTVIHMTALTLTLSKVTIPAAGEWYSWVRVMRPNGSNSFRSHGFWVIDGTEVEVKDK